MREIQKENRTPHSGIELLRKKINNEVYLNEAIQRIALVLTNEILDVSQGGLIRGRQWEKRK
jgi:hypothetical protein